MKSIGIATCGVALLAVQFGLSLQSAVAAPAFATTTVNLRQGPGTTYTVIGKIPGGSNIEVSGCSGEWCQVSFGGQNGYVIATSIGQGAAPPGGAPPPGAGAGPGAPPPGAPPPGYAGPPPGYDDPPPGYYGPPVYVAPPPYYGPYYYGYGPYGGGRGWGRRW